MNQRKKIAVIGMAVFGRSVSKRLHEAGAEVTIIDRDPAEVQSMRDFVTHAYVADGTDADALLELGIDQTDLVIIAIPKHLDMSVMVYMTLETIGVKEAWGLVDQRLEGRVLERLGVKRVIFPEHDSALREANVILNRGLADYFSLAEGYSLVEWPVPESFVGKSLVELDVRRKLGVTVVAVLHPQRPDDRPFMPGADYVFNAGDHLFVAGPNEKITKLTSKAS